jgi:hypothetical protein
MNTDTQMTLINPKIGDTVLLYSSHYKRGSRFLKITGRTPGGKWACDDESLWLADGSRYRGWESGYRITNNKEIIEATLQRLDEEDNARAKYQAEQKKLHESPEWQAAKLLVCGSMTDQEQIERWMKLRLDKLKLIAQWLRDEGVDL